MAARWVGNSRPLQMKKNPHGHLSSHQETELQLRLFVQGANCLVLEPIGYLFLFPEKLAPDGVSDISKITQMSLQVFQAFFDVDGPSFTMIFHNSLFFVTHGLFSTGWWFGTFFYVPFHIWDVILPID